MNIVFQENDWDCGAACLAMALGMKRASDLFPLLGFDPSEPEVKGVVDREVMSVLHRMGKRYHYECSRETTQKEFGAEAEVLEGRIGMPPERELRDRVASMLTGCAIVGVPSLNREGGTHFVFVKRGEVYDPKPLPGKRYIGTAYSLTPICVIYVLE